MMDREQIVDENTVNDAYAEDNRRFFAQTPTLALNIMGAPGAGKTSLLEKLILHLSHNLRAAVIEGDLASVKDAIRISGCNVPVVQINSGRGSILNAKMINQVLPGFHMENIDLLIIENVGNPAIPADLDLGEDLSIFVISLTGGEDKLAAYAESCKRADAIVLNKVDLLPQTGLALDDVIARVTEINPGAKIFQTCCRHGDIEGIEAISTYLTELARAKRQG